MGNNPYDVVHYDTLPRRQTHPDRLAAVSTLFGVESASLNHCRVLEVGCGNAGNLIPLAYSLPGAKFTGVDLADEPIAAGRRTAESLGLGNLSLHAMDLRQIGAAFGEFDYILAHGVYSWTSPEIRDALLAVCTERLAPRGVALVSYNAYPGSHVRQMLREMTLFHTQDVPEARSFLTWLNGRATAPESWRAALGPEIDAVLDRSDATLYHDDLAAINHPVYLWQFAQHASRHRLQYLGDADLAVMFDAHGTLAGMNLDRLSREQHLDFLHLRRFRHSLLCREGVELREPSAAQMERFLFSADVNRVAYSASDPRIRGLMQAFADCYPLPAGFDDLLPYAESPAVLRELLFWLVTTGVAELHVFDFPCEETVTAYPRASRLARFQAATSLRVTNACHNIVELDEVGRRLLLLLDGSRDHAAIATALADIPASGRHLRSSLEWMARMALLEG